MDPAVVGLAYCALFMVGMFTMVGGYCEEVTWLARAGTTIMAILVFKLLLIVILN